MTDFALRERYAPADTAPVRSLAGLLAALEHRGYDFMAPTPASQARVMARVDRRVGRSVEDLLGWSLPTRPETVPADIVRALDGAGMLERREDGLIKARLRVSAVFGRLFLHSAYPTEARDSVFLGPDSHRFADLIVRHAGGLPDGARVLDYAAGAGVGGITAAAQRAGTRLVLADVNPKALEFSSINAAFAGIDHQSRRVGRPADVDGQFDLVVTHPPFMMDAGKRAYRDGGDLHGGRLSLEWTLAALDLLAPGGRFVMHTGVSIVGGQDVLLAALRERMPSIGFHWEYRVLDPDIFGDELDRPAYADVDRIAAIGLVVEKARGTVAG